MWLFTRRLWNWLTMAISSNRRQRISKGGWWKESRQGMEADWRTCGGSQDSTSTDVHDFHRQGTGFVNKKEGSTALVLPFSLFCFRFKNERRIFFSCPQTFLHFVPTLQCQICGFVFGATAPSAIRTIRRIELSWCFKTTRHFKLWHTIINRIGSIGPVVNAHARYNFLYSHIYLHLSAPVKRCCPFLSLIHFCAQTIFDIIS